VPKQQDFLVEDRVVRRLKLKFDYLFKQSCVIMGDFNDGYEMKKLCHYSETSLMLMKWRSRIIMERQKWWLRNDDVPLWWDFGDVYQM